MRITSTSAVTCMLRVHVSPGAAGCLRGPAPGRTAGRAPATGGVRRVGAAGDCDGMGADAGARLRAEPEDGASEAGGDGVCDLDGEVEGDGQHWQREEAEEGGADVEHAKAVGPLRGDGGEHHEGQRERHARRQDGLVLARPVHQRPRDRCTAPRHCQHTTSAATGRPQ